MASSIEELAAQNAKVNEGFKQKFNLDIIRHSRISIVISCVDMRADPKDFWAIPSGYPPGIVRNAGGRAADAMKTLEALAVLGTGLDTVAVVHHTFCGVGPHGIDDAEIRKTLQDRGKGSAEDKAALKSKTWDTYKHSNEEKSVKEDMRLILANPLLPEDLKVLGFVLDVDTNLTSEVFL